MPKFLPIKRENAGTTVGVHYMMEFAKCPRKWFYKYYYPTQADDGSEIPTGIEQPVVAQPLLTGGLFHHAIEHYYRSGCVDGEDTGAYNIDVALAEAEKHMRSRVTDYADNDKATEDLSMVNDMLLAYDEKFGPNGYSPDFPSLKIMCNIEGVPLLEQEYSTPLGYSDYYLTCKVDGIIEHTGHVKVFEHKTTVASFMTARLGSIHHDAQFTGEILTLNHNMPEGTKLNGVLVNVVQKNRRPKSKYSIAERDSTRRTQAVINDFKNTCIGILQQIDERVENFNDWTAKGVDFPTCVGVWFPAQGPFNGECEAYRRHCDYYMLCGQPLKAEQLTKSYRPRVRAIAAPKETQK